MKRPVLLSNLDGTCYVFGGINNRTYQMEICGHENICSVLKTQSYILHEITCRKRKKKVRKINHSKTCI